MKKLITLLFVTIPLLLAMALKMDARYEAIVDGIALRRHFLARYEYLSWYIILYQGDQVNATLEDTRYSDGTSVEIFVKSGLFLNKPYAGIMETIIDKESAKKLEDANLFKKLN